MSPLERAQEYFDLSNKGDLEAIAEMFDANATYSSDNTGVYFGESQIMDMARPFYASFKTLCWNVHDVKEIRPNVVLFNFTFKGEQENKTIAKDGLEYVIINNENLIQHVEVRNK